MSMIRGFGPRKPGSKRKEKKAVPLARVRAEIQLESTKDIIEGRVFLSDLHASGVGLFVEKKLDRGETLSIVIEQPKHLFLKASVTSCSLYSLDKKVISAENFNYRVQVKFIFESDEEKDEVRKYCAELFSSADAVEKQRKAG